MGPTAADVFRRDRAVFLDLPGNPRLFTCTYERRFRRQLGDRPPLAYARVVREPDRTGLALQYWYFYYFNDWNNPHEGDWEMVQVGLGAGDELGFQLDEPLDHLGAQEDVDLVEAQLDDGNA